MCTGVTYIVPPRQSSSPFTATWPRGTVKLRFLFLFLSGLCLCLGIIVSASVWNYLRVELRSKNKSGYQNLLRPFILGMSLGKRQECLLEGCPESQASLKPPISLIVVYLETEKNYRDSWSRIWLWGRCTASKTNPLNQGHRNTSQKSPSKQQ